MTDRLPDVMTKQEWADFIGEFNERCATGLRNVAMFTLMREAGLRVGEAVALKIGDVREADLNGGTVTCLHLRHTKGDQERVVYLTDEADGLLRRWLAVKGEHGLARFRHVFTTLKGGPVADSYLRVVAARKGAAAGIGWRVHPHALRHTFATDLLEDTGDLALVQDALGHKDPKTTRVYARVRNGRLAAAMTGRHKREAEPEPATEAEDLAAQVLGALPAEVREAMARRLTEEA